MDKYLIVFIIVALIAIDVYSHRAKKKRQKSRRNNLEALAQKHGLSFDPGNNRNIVQTYDFLDRLQSGSDQYALNILSGNYKDNDIISFDFHYVTRLSGNTGTGSTNHNYCSLFILKLPMTFPELTISKDGILLKINHALEDNDIDFESHEFSRTFRVVSKNKKFAYDFCNAQMIEYLLSNTDLTIEIEGNALALAFVSLLKPDEIEYNLDRLVKIRSLMPNYLFD